MQLGSTAGAVNAEDEWQLKQELSLKVAWVAGIGLAPVAL